jgi:ribosome-binding protein aMBF1 (putative translation factor)
MSKKLVAAADLHATWMKRPGYAKAYATMEPEFVLASAIIEARAKAGLTQEQLAERMQTTRTAIARLESGRQMPSTPRKVCRRHRPQAPDQL